MDLNMAHIRTLLARGIKVAMLPPAPPKSVFTPEGMRRCQRCDALVKPRQHCRSCRQSKRG